MDVPAYRVSHQLKDQKCTAVTGDCAIHDRRKTVGTVANEANRSLPQANWSSHVDLHVLFSPCMANL